LPTRSDKQIQEIVDMPLPRLDRRTFLRSAGVCIGLPLLDAMLPIGPGAEQKAEKLRAKRMLLISNPLGL
jgi:hypothetical protein